MASTEIFIAKRNRTKWKYYGSVSNAMSGYYKFWLYIEDKYMEPVYNLLGKKTSRLHSFFTDETFKDVLELYKDARLTSEERLILIASFDYNYLPFENIPDFSRALRTVHSLMNNESNFEQQADMLDRLFSKYTVKEVKAVGFNLTDCSHYEDTLTEKYDKDDLWNIYDEFLLIEKEIEDGK